LPSAVVAWPTYRMLVAVKSRQNVSKHIAEHQHKQGTPTMGGLIVLVGMLLRPLYDLLTGQSSAGQVGIVLLVVGFALIGFVDDFVVPRMVKGSRGLEWGPKLLLQVGTAALATAFFSPATLPAFGLTVFLLLFFANAFNFTDGLDWLASTVFLAFAFGMIPIADGRGAEGLVALLTVTVGALLPFMVLNRPPAKLFMGDVGSMPIGGAMGLAAATLAVPGAAPAFGAASPTPALLAALALLSVIMVVELVPVPLQILSVKLRKKRLFPMTPIHHAFQKAGWKETRVVALFFGVQFVGSLLALAVVNLWR
jgi:phospho-N-acetylmuramoyl-pentapeptide-transferase